MATITELVQNVVRIRKFIAVYLDLPSLTPKQAAALKVDLQQLDRNLAKLEAAIGTPVVQVAAPAVAFNAPAIDPAYFKAAGESGDEVYIAGFEGGLSGEGVDWTLNRAVEWFKFVWTNGIDFHAVAPGLLPGSHCLTPEGYKFAIEFLRRDDLTVAPRDFNPLGLPVKP